LCHATQLRCWLAVIFPIIVDPQAILYACFSVAGQMGNISLFVPVPQSNNQDQLEEEKLKRAKGQSSVHGWKREAEMALHQQYDTVVFCHDGQDFAVRVLG
jgi:hypothetical protein